MYAVFDRPQFPGRCLAANGAVRERDAPGSQSPDASDNKTTAGRKRTNEVKTSEAKLNL